MSSAATSAAANVGRRPSALWWALLAAFAAAPFGIGWAGNDQRPASAYPWLTPPPMVPAVAEAVVIIDDLGDDLKAGRRTLALPGAVTVAVLPHTPYGRRLAEEAAASGREVMLHMPMQAKNGLDPGPGALTLDMDESQVRRELRRALRNIPHARGVNNHMGSLLTRHPGHMAWVMDELRTAGGFYFIDSRTSARSVALNIAAEHGLGHARRHVFLDSSREPEEIRRQLESLVVQARRWGAAVAIGHPYPETLEVLERELPRLKRQGVRLVPASRVAQPPILKEVSQWVSE